LLSYFQVEAPIHRPSFSLTIKDKTQISLTIKILHLGQGSFTRKVRTIFTLKIIVSIFVKLFLILVLHLRQFFIVRIFVKRATGPYIFFTNICTVFNKDFKLQKKNYMGISKYCFYINSWWINIFKKTILAIK
jgi:hypothetical protein